MKKNQDQRTTTTVTETRSPEALSPEEERVLRMRAGVVLHAGEQLGTKLDGLDSAIYADAAARLALMEADLLDLLPEGAMAPEPDVAIKGRIVDALRKKD